MNRKNFEIKTSKRLELSERVTVLQGKKATCTCIAEPKGSTAKNVASTNQGWLSFLYMSQFLQSKNNSLKIWLTRSLLYYYDSIMERCMFCLK